MNQLFQLNQLLAETETVLEQWIKNDTGRSVMLHLKPANKLKLYRLRVWGMRHKISTWEVISILVPIFRTVIGSKKKYGLGVPLSLLTSDRAHEILVRELEKRYPHGVLEVVFKEQEREKQLLIEQQEEWGGLTPRSQVPVALIYDAESPEAYLQAYEASSDKMKSGMDKAWNQKWRRRKAYRYNPWV